MLAIIYLALVFWIGDLICRRFYRFISVPHRLAAAFLIGLLTSTWFTYLTARMFASAMRPLLWGNLLFLVAVIAAFAWIRRKERPIKSPNTGETTDDEAAISTSDAEEKSEESSADVGAEVTPAAATLASDEHPVFEITNTDASLPPEEELNVKTPGQYLPRPAGSDRLDWLLVGVYFLIACWLMFATLNSTGGRLQIGNNQYSDFGPNTAIMQSFAVGHNFPTEYPHFAGDRIRYHFLFYFQAGNLEFLGLDPSWSLNLLSILSLVAMLILIMSLGEVLFNSRAVGRIGSALFFFFGSLSYIPYLRKQGSFRDALHAIANGRAFLPSVFPYRGEEWGVWSLVVFLNQRHLAFAIATVLLVLIFLVIRYREVRSKPPAVASGLSAEEESVMSEPRHVGVAGGLTADELSEKPAVADNKASEPPAIPSDLTTDTIPSQVPASPREPFIAVSHAFIFSGVLLGLLPMWNSAVFVAAAAVLAFLLLLFPLRKQMLALAITAGVIALPQVIYLSTGSGRAPAPELFHWGYTLDHPTIWNVIKYLGFIFGFKWLLIPFALALGTRLQRRFFLAICSLILVAFLFQLSVEVLANHKFLHIWIIIANLFVAYGLLRLWRLRLAGTTIPAKLVAVLFVILIIPGGVIDLFPIHNGYWTEITYKNDRLVDWLTKETDPRAIFLTDHFVTNPILMAGRRVFYGYQYYPWSAGYRTGERDELYRQFWQQRNPQALVRMLHESNISYVAIDDGVRHGNFGKNLNETVYRKNFPIAFQDGGYGSIVIFKVPETISSTASSETTVEESAPAVNMFTGGKGTGNGQFNWPRGIAIDDEGNVLVVDQNNSRIQRFTSDGTFISTFGSTGAGEGEFKDPCAVAVDRRGNIYVADFLNHRVQKFNSDGRFLVQLQGPDQTFAPRGLAVGSDNSVYVADEAGARIIKFDRDGKIVGIFGSSGSGDGQFNQITSLALDEKNARLYIADPRGRRIVGFDTKGKFVGNWFVEEWRPVENAWYMQSLTVDSESGRLFASSTQTDEVLIFDPTTGAKIASLKPTPPDGLQGASALTLLKNKLYVVNTFGARISVIDLGKLNLPTAQPVTKEKATGRK